MMKIPVYCRDFFERKVYMVMRYAMMTLCITQVVAADIVIRPIAMADVPAALELNAAICQEYFKPMFIKHYAHTPIGKDPDYYLGLDIANDNTLYPECAQNIGNEKLWIAYDQERDKVVGLIMFHQEHKDCVEVDLLLVDQHYRRQGLGKRLMQAALAPYEGIKRVGVCVFSHNYPALTFYQLLGFEMKTLPEERTTLYGLPFAELYVYLERQV